MTNHFYRPRTSLPTNPELISSFPSHIGPWDEIKTKLPTIL